MIERLKTIGTIIGAGLLGGAAALIFNVGALFDALGFLPAIGGLAVFLAASFFLQIVLHEGGHLAAGLLSGYEFSSFRVLSFHKLVPPALDALVASAPESVSALLPFEPLLEDELRRWPSGGRWRCCA